VGSRRKLIRSAGTSLDRRSNRSCHRYPRATALANPSTTTALTASEMTAALARGGHDRRLPADPSRA
jgi:hypothetical protein